MVKALNWLIANWQSVLGLITFAGALWGGLVAAIKTKNWGKLKEAIVEYIKDAEAMKTDGTVKKEIVMSKIRTLCVELGIRFDEAKISAAIENYIQLTKIVNARDKDKTP